MAKKPSPAVETPPAVGQPGTSRGAALFVDPAGTAAAMGMPSREMAAQFAGGIAPGQRPERVEFAPGSLGDTGLRIYGGYVVEEFLRELRGLTGMRTYREMADNDPVCGAILFAIQMLIRNVKWTVQATDESAEGTAGKEFLEEVLGDMSTPMSVVMSDICTIFPFGFAPLEIIWKKRSGMDAPDGESHSRYDDGKIGVRAITLRSQSSIIRWQIDPDDNSIDGLWQQPIAKPIVFIPIEKLLLFRTTAEKNNPEGRSILRNAYRPWYFKKRIEEIEAIGLERDLAGLPVAKIPAVYFDEAADTKEKSVLQEWKKLVTQIRRDQQEGILIPSDCFPNTSLPMFDLKLLSTGGSRQFDTTKVVDRYDRRIAMVVLADFVFLGQGNVGSFALSSDKTEMFGNAIGTCLNDMKDVFNQHFVPRLWYLNGLDPETMPTMEHGDIEGADLAKLSDFLSKLAAAGMPLFPDRELENHLRDAAGLPKAPEEGLEGNPAGNPPDVDPEARAQAAAASQNANGPQGAAAAMLGEDRTGSTRESTTRGSTTGGSSTGGSQ